MMLNDIITNPTEYEKLVQRSEGGDNSTSNETPIVVRNFQGTISAKKATVSGQISPEINKEKPWREVIKRSFINGRSDN